MSAVCTICNKRRAKRPCHATSTEICVLCCAEAREITLDCPRESSFLQEARKHESLVKLTPADVPHRDIVVSEDFVRDQEWVVLWLGNALTRAMERTKAVDSNAREALDAIVKRQRGIESRPEDPISAELAEALETAIAQWRTKAPEEGGPGPLKDSELLGVLIFIQRLGLQYDNGRARGRRFYDFMMDHFPTQSDGAGA
mgnify:FL=1